MARFLWAVVGVAIMCGAGAYAQPPQGNAASKLERIGGVVEGAGPGVLQVLNAHGTRWMVMPAPTGRISVRGDTTRDMLQKGQSVACEVTLDEAGKPTGPVKAVVFTGGGPAGVAMPGAGEGEGAAAPAAKPAPRGKRPAGTYVVSGPIKLVKGDVITVLAGKQRFEIEVAPDATFTVDTPNVGLAAKGDRVEMEGLYLQAGQLQATFLEVKLANPVVPPPPKGKPRPKAAL